MFKHYFKVSNNNMPVDFQLADNLFINMCSKLTLHKALNVRFPSG